MDFDPFKQIKEATDKDYLEQLLTFIDKDRENIRNGNYEFGDKMFKRDHAKENVKRHALCDKMESVVRARLAQL